MSELKVLTPFSGSGLADSLEPVTGFEVQRIGNNVVISIPNSDTKPIWISVYINQEQTKCK